jgi:hypothetical protein
MICTNPKPKTKANSPLAEPCFMQPCIQIKTTMIDNCDNTHVDGIDLSHEHKPEFPNIYNQSMYL